MQFHFETLQVSPISSISEKEEAECKISPYLLLNITVASLNVRRDSEHEGYRTYTKREIWMVISGL